MLEEVIEVLFFSALSVIGLAILVILMLKWARESFNFPDNAVRSLRNLLLSIIFLGSGCLFVWLLQGVEYEGLISFGLAAIIVLISGFCARKFLPLSEIPP